MNIWNILDGFNKYEKWGDPAQMNGMVILLLDAIRKQFRRIDMAARFIIHAGYATSGHSPNSQHYVGNAVDFHIDTKVKYSLQVHDMLGILRGLQVHDRVGLGIYPDWANPGFHLDVRGSRARWGRIGGEYKGFEETLIYAENKDW